MSSLLSRPPEQIEPDRDATVTALHEAVPVELQEGVLFRPLVGSFNGARQLTTGIVDFAAAATLECHTHPCSEAITVLSGIAEIQVEGRIYRLRPLDNIVIPRWLPHAARNPDRARPAILHVALAMGPPERTLVSREFTLKRMPDDSTGHAGAERVTRFESAKREQGVGPGAEFIDYFNAELVPGIEMSGGFARFQPQGRLPAHLHDFDESICITDGVANCLVEGQRYALGECATAMIPRGRVHYFVNNSTQPMDMIWVYAGPMPERIVVAERCGTQPRETWDDEGAS